VKSELSRSDTTPERGAYGITCREVTVVAGTRRLVDQVCLDVAAGEWVTVLGPNGAGKTTLLHALAGLVPARGHIALAGTPLARMRGRERARLVALVPQVPIVPPGVPVLDYVLLGRTPHTALLASQGGADIAAAWDALDALDLAPFAGRSVDSLSGGERQRALIARALAQHAPIVLLDEPTTSLDIGHQQDVLDLVDALRRRRGLTVLSTMHELTLAGQYADRLVMLTDGRIVLDGLPDDVLTIENLSRYYGARVSVIDGPDGRVVVPERPDRRRRRP
jgi:iron complex transport system ATP-binding protein